MSEQNYRWMIVVLSLSMLTCSLFSLLSSTPSAPTPIPSSPPTTTPLPPTAIPQPTPTATVVPTAPSTETLTPLPTTAGPFRYLAPLPENASDIIEWHATPDGALWLVTDAQIAQWQAGTWIPILTALPGTPIGVDNAGHVWTTDETGSEIAMWDDTRWITDGPEQGWTPPPVNYYGPPLFPGIVTDARGQLWVHTAFDVRRFDGARWTVFPPETMGMPPLEDDLIFEFTLAAAGPDGGLWVGQCNWSGPGPIGGRGARWFDGQTWHGATSPAAEGCVSAIVYDATRNAVWLGVRDTLWRYDVDGATWTEFVPPAPPTTLPVGNRYGAVLDITLDPAGDPWLTLLGCGGACCEAHVLFHLHAGQWRLIPPAFPDQLYNPAILAFDTAGTAWRFSRREPVYRIVGHALELEPMAELHVLHVTTGPDGALWLLAEQDGALGLWLLDAARASALP